MKSQKLYPVTCLNCYEVAFNFFHELRQGDRIYLQYIKEHRLHCGNCGCPLERVDKSAVQKERYWGIPYETLVCMFPDPLIKKVGLN